MTDREAEMILDLAYRIRLEDRKPVRRRNKIQNLSDKITSTISKAKRRKPKQPNLFEQ